MVQNKREFMTKQNEKTTLVKGNLDEKSREKLSHLIEGLNLDEQETIEKAEQIILDLMPPLIKLWGFANPKAWGGWLKKEAPKVLDNVKEKLTLESPQSDFVQVDINEGNSDSMISHDGSSSFSRDCFYAVARSVGGNSISPQGEEAHLPTATEIGGNVESIDNSSNP